MFLLKSLLPLPWGSGTTCKLPRPMKRLAQPRALPSTYPTHTCTALLQARPVPWLSCQTACSPALPFETPLGCHFLREASDVPAGPLTPPFLFSQHSCPHVMFAYVATCVLHPPGRSQGTWVCLTHLCITTRYVVGSQYMLVV